MLSLNVRSVPGCIIICCLLLISNCLTAQQIRYTDGKNSWNPDSLGNHRAVVQFTGKGNIAKAVIGWRRRDFHPELKRIIVQDAKTGKKILINKINTIYTHVGADSLILNSHFASRQTNWHHKESELHERRIKIWIEMCREDENTLSEWFIHEFM